MDAREAVPMKYIVHVDDNFHHGDESERYKLDEFDSCEEAMAACKRIVDEYFERLEMGKYGFKELWEGYTLYGEDPFIASKDKGCRFSAWDYAKMKCREYAKAE
jgi:hypothetical protein